MDHAFAGWVLLTDIPYMKAGSEHHIVCLLAPQPLASAVPEACMLRQSGLVYIERMRLDGEKQFKHALAGSMWIRPGASGNAAGAAALPASLRKETCGLLFSVIPDKFRPATGRFA